MPASQIPSRRPSALRAPACAIPSHIAARAPSQLPLPSTLCRVRSRALPPICILSSHAANVASQFIYRLTVCGELCLGLFTTSEDAPGHVATVSTAHVVESGAPQRKEFLLGMWRSLDAHDCIAK